VRNWSTPGVRGLGGKVLTDKTAVQDMGWFAIIADPTGAMLGLCKNKT
jgi:predicted enzyme related to lactoylglutathione lyase